MNADEAERLALELEKDDHGAAQEIQILLQIAAQRIPPSYGRPGAPR